MNPKDFAEMLTQLKTMLDPSMAVIWTSAVKHSYFVGIMQAILPPALFVISTAIGIPSMRYSLNADANEASIKNILMFTLSIVCTTVAVIMLIASLIVIPDGISRIMNPEWHAIADIAELVAGRSGD